MSAPARIKITQVDSNFEREPLQRPYHFKGNVLTQLWQTVAYLRSDSGMDAVGLGTQSILWSDARVFAAHSENGGNALMYLMTEWALQHLRGNTFHNPVDVVDELLPLVSNYGRVLTGNTQLRRTFALNALVAVDNAAWLLYAQENGFKSFDEIIPEAYRPALAHRHEQLVSLPAFGAGTKPQQLKEAVRQGYFMMKIKMGSPGSQPDMLARDIDLLNAVHSTLGPLRTKFTADGKIPYYFDANGRYEKKETLQRWLDHAEKIGALQHIAVIEEPFDEYSEADVRDLGVCIAADESAHTAEDVRRRIGQGYGAIAVKPVAKTLSMTLKILQVAHQNQIPCFCADLTVNPILVDWNKCVAARLAPLPQMNWGLLETNGHQYYRNWDRMISYHPRPEASWITSHNGIFNIDQSFYDHSGGIMEPSIHYQQMFGSGSTQK